MSIECPICRDDKSSYVSLECSHKICLKCYHNCIYHNHSKCSLCRKKIPELVETSELIDDLEERVDELEDANKDLENLIEIIEGEKEDLQCKFDEMWDQLN